MVAQISREEWIRRFGKEHGIRGWQPKEDPYASWGRPPAEDYQLAREKPDHLIGRGAFGTVVRSVDDPGAAIKRQYLGPVGAEELTGGRRRYDHEVDVQDYLGNLGVMPRILEVELAPEAQRANPPSGANAPEVAASLYLKQENLKEQGYETEKDLVNRQRAELGGNAGREDYARFQTLRAQRALAQSLAEAWMTRAKIKADDTHDENVMWRGPIGATGLTPMEELSERVKFVDPGFYQRTAEDEVVRTWQEGMALVRGYDKIGLSGVGDLARELLTELRQKDELDQLKDLVREVHLDLELRGNAMGDAPMTDTERLAMGIVTRLALREELNLL